MAVAVFHNYYETMLVTPLEFAVCVEDRYLSTIITRVLLSHGADPNFCGQGKCPLTDVAFAGATTVDDFFLEADTGIGQRINGNSLRNATILGIAVAEGNLEAARLLVLEGADTNAYEQTKLYGHACQITALGLAAGRGDIPIMNLLLDAGARVNPDTSSENCGPPLVVAVYSSTFGAMHLEEKRAEVVRLLLDSGAGIHADSSPFLACHENLRKCLMTRLLSFNDLDSFRLLLDAGCEASSDQMEEFNSASLLRYVEQKEDSFVYQRLIFDARRKEDAGGRALKSAIELGHHGIMYFLQKAGVTSLTRHPVDFIPTIKVARFLEEKRVLKEILAISGQRILVAAILYTKDLVSFLLENGADKSPDDDYLTTRSSKVLCMHPLEAALCQSDWKLSGDLIDRGAQIGEPEITAMVWSLLNNKVEPHSWFWSMLPSHRISAPTAIGMALKAKNYSLVYSLLNNGVDPRGTPVVFNYTKWKSVFGPIILDDQNHSDMAGWWNFKLISKDGPSSVLEMAEASGDSSIIRALLESGRWAEYARNPRIHALELGIKKTSVANTQVVVSGASSLQRAIQSGSIETVRAALETDREAVAAVLDDAVSTENFDAMNILIQAGLDLKKHTSESAQLQQKSTILQKAVITGNLALVKMLLAAGANINGRGVTGYGMDALRLAVEQGNIEILGFLLEQGAEVNQQVGHLAGPTALHIAASAGYIGIVRRLIDHGADINDSRGVTALEGAAKYGHIDILQLLFNEGAEIKGAGLVPYTRAIKLAEERGFYSAARLLRSFLD
ncbi:hypothetical protein N7466_004033 [Penicillium verhagenii]|uniref:uncharacterized protein n=1 Tax=Penicillium verhagenii TaxID=1562060 RepID=UPI0025453D28|nr:uncharacterized protein N7466_004033 [Penicillium verhagenii]KAJ5934486.1 hypothetical protein N7466_004033 [Penicillium verhagenii]